MKKLILSVAVAALGLLQVNAQDAPIFGFAEGDVIVEGSVNFNSTNDKNSDVKTNKFGISPKVGFFISDDLAIGASLNVSSGKIESSGVDTSKKSEFGVGVFGRYYFLDLGARFKTFTELGLGYNTSDDKIADLKENTLGANLDLGINYFVKENIALTFSLDNLISFSSSKYDVDGAKAVSSFDLGAGDVNNPFATASFGVLFKF
ncbi:outer membrane beta-barrel protein [Mariniflexile ostreae]|uniref:Outer membrane beta-barrel protein n=1 Tax=Mariniflexile ostreae TaxID=1520892 RepID=A0ABV5FDP6_9FLAO